MTPLLLPIQTQRLWHNTMDLLCCQSMNADVTNSGLQHHRPTLSLWKGHSLHHSQSFLSLTLINTHPQEDEETEPTLLLTHWVIFPTVFVCCELKIFLPHLSVPWDPGIQEGLGEQSEPRAPSYCTWETNPVLQLATESSDPSTTHTEGTLGLFWFFHAIFHFAWGQTQNIHSPINLQTTKEKTSIM